MLRRSRQNGAACCGRCGPRCWRCRQEYRNGCRTSHRYRDRRRGQGAADRDQPPLGGHRDSKKAPNKNIDPDIAGTPTGPLKRSSVVQMSNVATVENATPNPRQMIAKKYFTFMGLARRFPLVLRCCDLAPSHALLAPKH